MSLIVKCLADNVLNSASQFTNVYPSSGVAVNPALVKRMRFVNTNTTQPATLALSVVQGTGQDAVERQITGTVTVPAGALFIEDSEITLGVGEAIKAKGAQFDFVISGIEREA